MATTNISLKSMASKMAGIDVCMMTTTDGRGVLHSRPMSNNGEVEYKGDSYFFTYEKSKVVKEIMLNSQVNLAFTGTGSVYISVNGKAKLNKKRTDMEEHWTKGLQKWFKDGIDTKGLVMIHVKGKFIRYWEKEKMGFRKMP